MVKKLIISILLVFGFFAVPLPAFAENSVNVYLFWGDGCPHCAKEKPFLENLDKTSPDVTVHMFEVWGDKSNMELFEKVGKKLAVDVGGVPFTVIGDQHIVGYLNDETTGKQIEDMIAVCRKEVCADPVGELLGSRGSYPQQVTATQNEVKTIPETLNLPLVGTIKTKDVSLPVLTIIIGGLDGFNPCAMWTLIFLLSLLIGMHDRRRMWILGTAFIFSSAAVYFLFMAAWLHLILFIGFVFWIRVAIGLLALGGGIYNIREFYKNKDNACKVTNTKERRRVFDSLKQFTQEKHFLLALGGIIVLAAAVNIVELICSAGLPVIYTQILSLSNLPVWQYYLYLLLYIFIFMLDDLIVFFVTMKTAEVAGITTKYSRYSHIIGGVVMILIGLLLLFKPELLMFG